MELCDNIKALHAEDLLFMFCFKLGFKKINSLRKHHYVKNRRCKTADYLVYTPNQCHNASITKQRICTYKQVDPAPRREAERLEERVNYRVARTSPLLAVSGVYPEHISQEEPTTTS